MKIRILILIILLAAPVVNSAVIRVPDDYATLQAGIDASCDGDTVLVADGTFTGTGNTSLTWDGFEKHIILTSETGMDNCIIDCEGGSSAFFFSDTGQVESDRISGFTIRNAEGQVYGAIYCNRVSLTIDGCRFENNLAGHNDLGMGGAIHSQLSDILITECEFSGNESRYRGGGIYCRNSMPIIENCIFTSNIAETGAGLYLRGSPAVVTDCIFTENQSQYYGGGVSAHNSEAVLHRNTFQSNRALMGGGAMCTGDCFPVIGGESGNGNDFNGNIAVGGCDLGALEILSEQVNARFNNFSGHVQSDYAVSPLESFDISGSVSGGTAIDQDLFVTVDGNDSWDGLSWSTAFRTVHHALSVIYGNNETPLTIYLGPGTFSPSATVELFPLPLITGVNIVGDDTVDTILDAESGSGVIVACIDSDITLENLVITGGEALLGGGIAEYSGSILVENCRITGNNAISGGGIYLGSGSTGTYRNCVISDNTSYAGAGIMIASSSPEIQGCIIENNSGESGGAVYMIYSESTLQDCIIQGNVPCGVSALVGTDLLEDCLISGNHSESNFAGGIESVAGNLTVMNCTIRDNSTTGAGGGILTNHSEDVYSDCVIENNQGNTGGGIAVQSRNTSLFQRCIIRGNTAVETGGGVYCMAYGDALYPVFTNCLITGNFTGGTGTAVTVEDGAAPVFCNTTVTGHESATEAFRVINSTLTAVNAIFWNQTGSEISSENSILAVIYSNVRGGCSGKCNIDADPLFLDPDNYRLTAASPCVDTGTDAGAPMDDLDGQARWLGGAYDMGAYEFDGYPSDSRIYMRMPAHEFTGGSECSAETTVWNASGSPVSDQPLFVLLSVGDQFLFAPSFSSFDYFQLEFSPGVTTLPILSAFTWPAGVDAASAVWYAAMTDAGITRIIGSMAIWEFSWN